MSKSVNTDTRRPSEAAARREFAAGAGAKALWWHAPTILTGAALGQARKAAPVFCYLWVLFGLFALYKWMLLPDKGFLIGQGLAFVNAFVLVKIVLVAEHLQVGENFRNQPLIYPVLLKSALFALILIGCHLAERVVHGALRGGITGSLSEVGGGTVAGILALGIIIFVVLIPFFAFRELARVVGDRELSDLLFVRRTRLAPLPRQPGDP